MFVKNKKFEWGLFIFGLFENLLVKRFVLVKVNRLSFVGGSKYLVWFMVSLVSC